MDLYRVLWMKAPSSEAWLERRSNFSKSLAVMSMVGYMLGMSRNGLQPKPAIDPARASALAGRDATCSHVPPSLWPRVHTSRHRSGRVFTRPAIALAACSHVAPSLWSRVHTSRHRSGHVFTRPAIALAACSHVAPSLWPRVHTSRHRSGRVFTRPAIALAASRDSSVFSSRVWQDWAIATHPI